MGLFVITDSMSRLHATLQCLKTVIQSYETPTGHTLSRHFTPHVLNPQIEYLAACRPLCVSMGNAIRWLKKQVANMDPDLPEDEAKELLCEAIDAFARERVGLADVVITRAAAERINDGGRVVTYGHHAFVEQAIRKAIEEDGKEFTLVIIDDPHEPVGQEFATRISALEGLDVTYCPDLGSLQWALNGASVLLVGAEAMFSNGATYATAGTCDVAVAAHAEQVQVIALCASVGVSERLAIDSLSHNEIDPEHCTEGDFRLMFDTTPPRYVDEVMTEMGNTRPTGVPAVLSKLEDL
jgi:translation initiation factor eIF-2B subunit delta